MATEDDERSEAGRQADRAEGGGDERRLVLVARGTRAVEVVDGGDLRAVEAGGVTAERCRAGVGP